MADTAEAAEVAEETTTEEVTDAGAADTTSTPDQADAEGDDAGAQESVASEPEAQLTELTSKLTEAVHSLQARIDELEAARAKDVAASERTAALEKAGLPASAARFLPENKADWAEAIAALKALAPEPTVKSRPRDPAVGASQSEDEKLATARAFLGIN